MMSSLVRTAQQTRHLLFEAVIGVFSADRFQRPAREGTRVGPVGAQRARFQRNGGGSALWDGHGHYWSGCRRLLVVIVDFTLSRRQGCRRRCRTWRRRFGGARLAFGGTPDGGLEAARHVGQVL